MGRSGHALSRTPKGRVFPLTPDELVAAAALLRSVRQGALDVTAVPRAPLDVLAQQIVAACVAESWAEGQLYERLRIAWPYRDLSQEEFDEVVRLHTDGRRALLHRDGVALRLLGFRELSWAPPPSVAQCVLFMTSLVLMVSLSSARRISVRMCSIPASIKSAILVAEHLVPLDSGIYKPAGSPCATITKFF